MLGFSIHFHEKNVGLNVGLGIVMKASAWSISREDTLCVTHPCWHQCQLSYNMSKRRGT